jgi:hypothetical protein
MGPLREPTCDPALGAAQTRHVAISAELSSLARSGLYLASYRSRYGCHSRSLPSGWLRVHARSNLDVAGSCARNLSVPTAPVVLYAPSGNYAHLSLLLYLCFEQTNASRARV